MAIRKFTIILFSCLSIFLVTTNNYAQTEVNERHIKVGLRMIGDQILLNSGDSVSRVLPIEKEADRYKIEFESGFRFNPVEMVGTINDVVIETGIAVSYLVEVENCETNKVIYSYEIDNSTKKDLIPCQSRIQPRACYKLFITILDPGQPAVSLYYEATPGKEVPPNKSRISYFGIVLPVLLCAAILGLVVYFRKRRQTPPAPDLDVIQIGQYQFNKRGMTLSFKDETTELSGKEADLLHLLCNSENETLKREHILEVVWGDEGDYVGRTLDVFISKLRKKLMADTRIKIINIRGIGYKFVVDGQG